MSNIIILGGHGKIALLAAPLLVHDGHRVQSVIRNPEHSNDVKETGAEPVIADLQETTVNEFAELFKDVDIVVWSAGAGGGNPERTYAIDRDAAIRSMTAAQKAGAQRYVMVSYDGAGHDHGVDPNNPFYPYAEAKTAADEALRSSSLDWTILQPSALTLDPPTGLITTRTRANPKEYITRADVATVIAAVIADPSSIGKTIPFINGDTLIAEAVANA